SAEPFREWRQRVLGLGAEKSAGCLICAFRVKALDPAPPRRTAPLCAPPPLLPLRLGSDL
ncbi:MAG: hypothetical protein FWF88_06550, partial [Peptococcaceae bacterium]|nr:hypothetical protein [Peptococcaceae bacterium]